MKDENIKAAQEKKLLGSNLASAKSDAKIRLSKACTALNKLRMIYKSSLTSESGNQF